MMIPAALACLSVSCSDVPYDHGIMSDVDVNRFLERYNELKGKMKENKVMNPQREHQVLADLAYDTYFHNPAYMQSKALADPGLYQAFLEGYAQCLRYAGYNDKNADVTIQVRIRRAGTADRRSSGESHDSPPKSRKANGSSGSRPSSSTRKRDGGAKPSTDKSEPKLYQEAPKEAPKAAPFFPKMKLTH